ncbi:Asp23/Gls24 family envelope stress response protein [Actinacidiphila sp. bgisy167]|uniref:Asp23/Gls24 family envelope stress response protein n=1 Tax=Actinacidiphila sp. bgisy167 TaxID=3413797 RepID=UPI003D70E419
MAVDDQPPPPPQEPAENSALDEVRLRTGDEVLTCGRTLRHAWEQARDTSHPADPHIAGCPYCRDAIEGLAALDQATRALRDQEPPSTHRLVSRIMDIVRDEVRRGPLLRLDDPTRTLQIAEQTAAAALRRAADQVPGVTTASCHLAPAEPGEGVHANMTIAAGLNRPLPETAEHVRRAVAEAADHELGLVLASIDIKVIEVAPTPETPYFPGPAHHASDENP